MTDYERVDAHPTHWIDGHAVRAGRPLPFGAHRVPGGVNFSIFSTHAEACTLVLFELGAERPLAELPFPREFRIGNVYAMVVFGLDAEHIEYGYRFDGPWQPTEGHRFDPRLVVLDPYAKVIGGRDVWGLPPERSPYPHRGRIGFEDFDWESDRPLEIPLEDLIIYEMHVRGFTRHPSSGVRHPGTFAGIRDKIPYLRELGINCVELMPIFEFDEHEISRLDDRDERVNYWGYSTIGFFAPKAGYARTGAIGMQMDELKALVKELHRNGIEVILDVVYNHTAEGDERGPVISFRGIDNKTYYLLNPHGGYYNFSGTGNTLNCNNPVVRQLVLDSLRYWASEYHIDGFRFDLASILGRDTNGEPLENPPLLEQLAYDPILAHCKLIAEAWDAGGLYQVGVFPAYGRWAEWNGRYRDTVRRFLRGDMGQVRDLSQRLIGSPDLYGQRGTAATINFITCHDGFTLADLYAYERKRNEENREENRDGANDNYSWNCGVEGQTADAAIARLRSRMMKNAIALLMVSHGVPMLAMGDELGRSQKGNNNAYCHDTPDNWLDWGLREDNADHLRFVRRLIHFRREHPILRTKHHPRAPGVPGEGPLVTLHGDAKGRPNLADWSRTFAYQIQGAERWSDHALSAIYVAANMHWQAHPFAVPPPPRGTRWHRFVDTFRSAPDDACEPGHEPPVAGIAPSVVGPRSVLILVSRPI